MTEEKTSEVTWKNIIVHLFLVGSGIGVMIVYTFELFTNDMIGKLATSLDSLITEFTLFIEINIVLFIGIIWAVAAWIVFMKDEMKVTKEEIE